MINNRQNGRRRGRNGPRPQGGAPRTDGGNRIDNRARGNAAQLHEKYKSLARDAQMQGDRVLTEYYFQFADHYFRILMESRPRGEDGQQQQQGRRDYNGNGRYDQDNMSEGYEGDEGSPDEAFGGDRYERPRYETRPQGDQRQQGEQRPQGDGRQQSDSRQQANGRYEQQGQNDGRREPDAAVQQAQPLQADRYANGSDDEVADEAPRRRRGRPRREDNEGAAPERIEVDRLPPAMSAEPAPAAAAGEEPAPRRRGRPRRVVEEGPAPAEA